MRIRENRVQTVLRVDLSDGSFSKEELPEEWTGKYIGARGLTSRLLYDEGNN